MDTIIKTKQCTFCEKTFSKRSCESVKYWENKKFCSSICSGIANNTAQQLIGRKRPPGVIEKLRPTMFQIGQVAPMKGRHNRKIAGSKSHLWKGGVTPSNEKARKSLEYKLWREAVFTRDNWTCQWCGVRGGNIHADHIKEFALFPELRTAIDNGRTLCISCHKIRHK